MVDRSVVVAIGVTKAVQVMVLTVEVVNRSPATVVAIITMSIVVTAGDSSRSGSIAMADR